MIDPEVRAALIRQRDRQNRRYLAIEFVTRWTGIDWLRQPTKRQQIAHLFEIAQHHDDQIRVLRKTQAAPSISVSLPESAPVSDAIARSVRRETGEGRTL